MPKIILFNKPYGVLCQFQSAIHEKTLADYIKIPNVYAAGRLDKNSEGLLLLTDDGNLQHRLTHPKYHKKKCYWVQVEGNIAEANLEPLRLGLKLSNVTYLPAMAKIVNEPTGLWERIPPIRFRQSIPTSWLEIVIYEGKNHQIRKMTAAIGFPTLRLIRYQIDNFDLKGLSSGSYRILQV